MDAIVEVETPVLSMVTSETVIVCAYIITAIANVPTLVLVSTSAVVPAIGGTSISAVSPDNYFIGGTALGAA